MPPVGKYPLRSSFWHTHDLFLLMPPTRLSTVNADYSCLCSAEPSWMQWLIIWNMRFTVCSQFFVVCALSGSDRSRLILILVEGRVMIQSRRSDDRLPWFWWQAHIQVGTMTIFLLIVSRKVIIGQWWSGDRSEHAREWYDQELLP